MPPQVMAALPKAALVAVALLKVLGPLVLFMALAYVVIQYGKHIKYASAPLGLDGLI